MPEPPHDSTPMGGKVVGLSGLEPLTSRLSGGRSNQLSYRPEAGRLANDQVGVPRREVRVAFVNVQAIYASPSSELDV